MQLILVCCVSFAVLLVAIDEVSYNLGQFDIKLSSADDSLMSIRIVNTANEQAVFDAITPPFLYVGQSSYVGAPVLNGNYNVPIDEDEKILYLTDYVTLESTVYNRQINVEKLTCTGQLLSRADSTVSYQYSLVFSVALSIHDVDVDPSVSGTVVSFTITTSAPESIRCSRTLCKHYTTLYILYHTI